MYEVGIQTEKYNRLKSVFFSKETLFIERKPYKINVFMMCLGK